MDSEEVIGLIVFGTLVIEGSERDGRHYSVGNHVRDLGVGDLGLELLQQKRGLERSLYRCLIVTPLGGVKVRDDQTGRVGVWPHWSA
jgi:hypothetical protein